MKVSERLESLRLRVGAWNRERKERAAEKKAERAAHLHPAAAQLLWCVLLTMVGVAALSGSTWMLLVFIAGSVGHVDWSSTYAATEAGVTANHWTFEMDIHWLVAVGLFLFCLAIAIFNATWLEARKHLQDIIKNIVTALGCVVALFMVSGAVVVQQRGTDLRARDEVIAAQTAQVGANEAAARLAYAQQRLREMRSNPNSYMAQAASVGAAEWEHTYIAQARASNDPRLPMIERALGAARAADAQEAEIARLTVATAGAQTQTVQAAAVTVHATGFMAPVTAFLEDLRKPLTAVLGELLALTAFGFALAAWRSRRAPEGYGSIPQHQYMIEDHVGEEVVIGTASPAREAAREVFARGGTREEAEEAAHAASRLTPAQSSLKDADTDEVIIDKDGHLARRVREHTRKIKGKDGKPVQMVMPAQAPLPDETGVAQDGGGRIGTKGEHEPLAAEVDGEQVAAQPPHSGVAMEASAPGAGNGVSDTPIEPQLTLSLEQDDIEAFSYADDESTPAMEVAAVPELVEAHQHEHAQDESSEPLPTEENGASEAQGAAEEQSEPEHHQEPPPATEPEPQEAAEADERIVPRALIAAE